MDGELTLVTDATVEPILADMELKNHLHIDHEDENDLLDGLIVAARKYFEEATRRALITQTWRYTLDDWPAGRIIKLPRPPLQSVTSIDYLDEDGNSTTWATSNYIVDTDGGRISLAANKDWPTADLYPVGAIRITFVAGYTSASAVPKQMRHCLKLLIGHWYENREGTVTGAGLSRQVPFGIESLIYLNRAY